MMLFIPAFYLIWIYILLLFDHNANYSTLSYLVITAYILEVGMIVWSDWVEMFIEQQSQEEIAGLILTPE